jgi:choline dehydrogenase
MYVSSLPENAAFDYVIVGAGSSGCVLANRLSTDGRHQVLLIEAGGRDNHLNIHIPLFVARLLMDERLTWPFKTEPQTHLNGKQQLWVRGRVLGGSSSINGNLFVRGDPAEYDNWCDAGCKGWSYADLLPLFKRLEDFPEGDPVVRGSGGPIGVTSLRNFDALSNAFVDACEQNGYRRLEDYNDGSYEGTFPLQYSTRKGLRSSSAVAYLRPAVKRRNLTVLTNAAVTRVLMDGRRATGVEIAYAGKLQPVKARREVVLSAGPLKSPQLLELSGIGNADVVQKHGIGVVHHLPGVGENLRDHPNVRLTYECTEPITINDVLRNPLLRMKAGLRFIFTRKGMLTICSATAQTNLRTDAQAKQPNLVLRLLPVSGKDRYARTARYGLDPHPGFTLGITPLQPRSTGTVHIRSTDPHEQAAMDPRYLSHEADAQLFLDGMRLAREVAQRPALKAMIVRETRPGPGLTDDAGMLDYIRDTVQTSWHMVGTCKMGVDENAVVDPQLRVHGIENLRVIDSSICPTIPSSNTNAAALAIGEKGADLMFAAAR